MHNTSDHSLVLGSPLWGSLYGAELTCWQNQLQLPCGSLTLVATPSLSPACRAHSSFCRDEEKVMMVMDKTMMVMLMVMTVSRWFFCHLQIFWRRALPTPRWRWFGRSLGVGGELISFLTPTKFLDLKVGGELLRVNFGWRMRRCRAGGWWRGRLGREQGRSCWTGCKRRKPIYSLSALRAPGCPRI